MSDSTRADEPTVRPKRIPSGVTDADRTGAVPHETASDPAIAPKSAAGSGAAAARASAPGIGPKSDETGPKRRIGPKPTTDTTPTTRNPDATNGEPVDE